MRERIQDEEQGEKRQQLHNTLSAIGGLVGIGSSQPSVAEQDWDTLKAQLAKKAELFAATQGVALKALFDAADEVLKKGAWPNGNTCPLCESHDLEMPLASTVAKKLAQFENVRLQSALIQKTWSESTVSARLRVLESARDLSVAEGEKIVVSIDRLVNTGQIDTTAVETAVSALTALETKLVESIKALEASKTLLESSLPPSLVQLSEQIQAAVQFRDALRDHKQSTEKRGLAAKRIATRERWQVFIGRAAKLFAESESDLAQRKIDAIDAEYKDLFARIMNVKDVVPTLHRVEDRQDLHVHLSDFHGLSNLSARALLSESFRNALAVSVFLSAALKQTGAPRFVVLDDVTSSFDSGHQWLLMEAIRLSLQQPNNSHGLQFILFSHDGLLSKYFDKLGSTPDWHHQKLQGMPPMGAVVAQVQDGERLKKAAQRLLNAGQTTEAQPLLRQYLEFKLVQIITKVSIPVPIDFAIKDHQRMAGNCLDAINAAIQLHKTASNLILTASQIKDIDTIHLPALVGNWVTHYETGAGCSVSPAVLSSVISTIDLFAECFRYDDSAIGTIKRTWYRSLSAK